MSSEVSVRPEGMPEIVVAPLAGPALLRDYLAGEPRAAGFFTGHPYDPAAYRRKAAEVDARLDAAARTRLADAFRPLGRAATTKLAEVLAGRGYFVTTGQQTGLFTGPLYTVYKALSAIRLAAALEELLQKPVLALFWSAADDHDWDEVDHATVLDAQGYPQRIRLGERGSEPPLPMSARRLDGSVALALDELRGVLPVGSRREAYLQLLRSAYSPGRTMAAAFEDFLAAVLGGQEIAVVSSAHPLVKLHSVPVLRPALEQAAAAEALVASQTERLLQAGYHAQVSIAPGASNVFFTDEAGRDRLVREGGRWSLRRARRAFTAAELGRRLVAEPQAFSPNVLLRPVVESALFPTLAYVGGPAETSYFGQIGCLFRGQGIMPPVAFPRHSITLVEAPVQRALEKFGMELAQLREPVDRLLEAVVRRELPEAVLAGLAQLRGAIATGYRSLAGEAEPVAPGVSSPLAAAERQALAQVAAMEKKIVQHAEREQGMHYEQLRRAAGMIQPDGAPQERTLNVLPFQVRYGPGLLDRILAALPVEIGVAHPAFAGVSCREEPLAPASTAGIA